MNSISKLNSANSNKINFEKYDGRNSIVAIIDSGIDNNFDLLKKRIIDKKDFTINTVNFHEKELCKDNIGHGTACAGIIIKKAPEIGLLVIKIFDKELSTSYELLLKALDFAIEGKVNIINLSLGITKPRNVNELKKLCEKAYKKNIIIVSAEHELGIPSYPSCFENVFGVAPGKINTKYGYFIKSVNPIRLIARGNRQKVYWLDGRCIFISGSSFAASHITSIIALIMQKYPNSNIEKIKEILVSNSEIYATKE